MPKVSIITINLNDRVGLEKTMNSVLNQTFQDFEYIVIDGGSTDGSVNLIRKSKDSLAYWISEKDTGIYNAMNKGIKQARGEYLLFLNSGDYLYKEDVLDRIIEKQLKSDIIYGDMILDLEDIDSRKMIKIKEKKISQYFFMKNSLPHPCSFIKKSLFDKIGLYNESLKIVADYEFFLKAILKAGATFTHIPHIVSVFNNGGISNSNFFKEKKNLEKKQVLKENYSKISYWIYLLYVGFKKVTGFYLFRKMLRELLLKLGVLRIIHRKKSDFLKKKELADNINERKSQHNHH